jgi:hypothetical protein
MRAIPVSHNRQLFITAKFWKTLEYVAMGSLRIGSTVLVVRRIRVRSIGGQERGCGAQALDLLFSRDQLNVTGIPSARIWKT